VLALLYVGVFFAVVAAWVMILATGRYPSLQIAGMTWPRLRIAGNPRPVRTYPDARAART
jgi:hypothetical protein